MDKVVHFELPADNIERAKKFYKEAFDWQMQDVPEMNYVVLRTAEVDEKMVPKEVGVINGGMFKRGDMNDLIKSPSLSINVFDIDEVIKKIKNAGGLILRDKISVGNTGLVAYFKDTEGNILSVWQSIKKEATPGMEIA